MLRRLDRYILAEILGPLALGFLIFTFIFLINVLFKSADLIIRAEVPASTVGKLLLVSLPSIIVLTIPIALLFSILIAVGRLSSDSELTAIRSCGVSLFSLYRPILVLSSVLTGLCVFLMLEVLPEGNRALQQLRVELLTRSLTQEIEPRMPYTAWEDKILYIFEAPPDGSRWHGVFLSDANPATTESQVIVASWGQAEALDDGDRILLTLDDACNHQIDFTKPIRYELGCHEDSHFVLDTQSSAKAAASSVKPGLRELTFDELREQAKDPEVDATTRYLTTVELHKKFSIPATCLVFGLLALPLGFSNARGGRSSGFALSLGVVMAYYVLLISGEELARKGLIPASISVWIANVFYLLLGLFLLARRNSDKSLLLHRLDRWIQEQAWGRLLNLLQNRENLRQAKKERTAASRARRKETRADLVLLLPQVRLRFPNSIDRYVLAAYLKVLLVVSCACLAIYIVADLTDMADEIIKNGISRDVVIRYYQYKCFTILYQIAPIVVLATTLVTFGLLSRTNEITAFKAAGVSLFRLALPVVIVSLALAAFVGWLQAEILPAASSQVAELEAAIRNRPSKQRRFQRADRRWLYGRGEGEGVHYLYNYLSYDEEKQTLSRLQVFKFDTDYRLVNRLLADKVTYAGEGWWTFSDGWVRTFEGSSVSSFRRFTEPVRDHLPEDPDYFKGNVRLPHEMSYRELRKYLEDLREIGGQEVPLLEVELHNKIAYPAITVVMALVALPFAFRLGRRGALYGIGLSLILGIVLMIFLAIFSALGKATILPPLVAVWSPSILFAIFSLYLFLGVRT